MSSSGSKRGIPCLENLERTSDTFFNVFSRFSSGKRSFAIMSLTLLKLSI
ncbi:hypothetical protein HanIR_Chr10g0476071 [Helianthus annuus]|nr:hypothetical protein HanIR_Chr10g0476071 [Helianthus annuus]